MSLKLYTSTYLPNTCKIRTTKKDFPDDVYKKKKKTSPEGKAGCKCNKLSEMREIDMSMISLGDSLAINENFVSHMPQKQMEYKCKVVYPHTIFQS